MQINRSFPKIDTPTKLNNKTIFVVKLIVFRHEMALVFFSINKENGALKAKISLNLKNDVF